MKQYLELIHAALNGTPRLDRTGVGTIGIFGYQNRYNLLDGFPLVTTKKVKIESIIHELIWFLNGESNIKYLNEHGVKIWNEWALPNGDLGPVYGKMWRSWPSQKFVFKAAGVGLVDEPVDQIAELIRGLKQKPFSRRHLVSGWNPALLPDENKSHKENVESGRQALPPCHTMFQMYVREAKVPDRIKYAKLVGLIDDAKADYLLNAYNESEYLEVDATLSHLSIPTFQLDCQLYQRSADIMLGVPFNIASYSLLTMMVAHVCGFIYGDFVHCFGDAHIYSNHIDGASEQLLRSPKQLPVLKINYTGQEIDQFKIEDFELIGYDPHPYIKFDIAV